MSSTRSLRGRGRRVRSEAKLQISPASRRHLRLGLAASTRSSSSRLLAVVVLLVVSSSLGCWEQMAPNWFPQMKRQPAIQAFEVVEWNGQGEGFSPPEGSVPVGAGAIPDLGALELAEQDALQNPQPANLASLKNGEEKYQRYCATCHGAGGLGDGPVAAASPFAQNATGPFAMVLPLAGAMSMSKVYSDGHIYTTISRGRGRMPNYNRVQASDRWDIVNYIREINKN